MSGAMAERVSIFGYLLYTILISTFVYPIVAHWVWSSDGWLSAFNPNRPAGMKNDKKDGK